MTSIRAIIAPLISTALFMLGNGYFNTFVSLRMADLGHSELSIGIVASAYYIGLVLGALQIAKFIVKAGHLRVFASFIGLFNCVCLVHAISDNVFLWFFLRFLSGISLAGFYITIESWLLECSSNRNRGVILAFYMVAVSSAQAFGQLLLDKYNTNSTMPYIVVTILLSLSILPVAISSNKIVKYRDHDIEIISIAHLAKFASGSIFACFVSGLILSSIYSLLPLLFEQVTQNAEKTAYLMFVTLLGGMILQYPIGLLSDNYDRRKVLILVSCLLVFICATVLIVEHQKFDFEELALLYFVFGGLSFTFYPVALSMICDSLRSSHIVSATQSLSMIEGIGSMVGPILASPFMKILGFEGLTIYFTIVSSCLIFFLLYRNIKKEKTSHHNHFVVAVHTTPVVAELDPRGDEGSTN
jgi:MFS family permease